MSTPIGGTHGALRSLAGLVEEDFAAQQGRLKDALDPTDGGDFLRSIASVVTGHGDKVTAVAPR
ncbi:hypothetical protein [Streptomyces sp. NPDC007172]|uniref:hypothetical protein n=1 Tax=Streptomyces sp. NPDC007172 TaxID=3364776 RepID=UPI00367671BD